MSIRLRYHTHQEKTTRFADGLSIQTEVSTDLSEYSQNLLKKLMGKTIVLNAISILVPGTDIHTDLKEEHIKDPEF